MISQANIETSANTFVFQKNHLCKGDILYPFETVMSKTIVFRNRSVITDVFQTIKFVIRVLQMFVIAEVVFNTNICLCLKCIKRKYDS